MKIARVNDQPFGIITSSSGIGGQWTGNGTGLFETVISGGGSTVFDHGTTGAAETIDPADGNVHTMTLGANCTFTLITPTSGPMCTIELYLTQDGTGGRIVTWPGSLVWPGGTTPTLSTAGAAIDRFILESHDGGTTWFGVQVGVASGSASPLTTKGDLYGYSTVGARVPVGTDTYLLKADSSASVGVSYVDPTAMGHYEILMASGSADPLLTSDGLDYLYVWVT